MVDKNIEKWYNDGQEWVILFNLQKIQWVCHEYEQKTKEIY